MKGRILVIDDEPSIRTSLSELFSSKGAKVSTAENGSAGLTLIEQGDEARNYDVVLLDVQLPDLNGLEVLSKIGELRPDLPVIMITGHGSVPQSVEAMNKGAVDYILKPFNIEELLIRVEKAMTARDLEGQVEFLTQRVNGDWDAQYVVGPNKKMEEVFDRVELVATSDSTTVFIHGETGTGKEVIARRIHNMSKRAHKPFVEVNATALTAELLESELFGHEEGSFTGAVGTKKGLFEVANGGTLFLDEIGDMDLMMQAKILRAIQERKIRRVGGTDHHEVDIRLITASNRDLEKMVREGKFREDLYYRLNVVPIVLPPLRERPDDLETLVLHFVKEFNRSFRKEITKLSADALQALQAYSWPGNVRELRNLLERTTLLEVRGDTIEAEHLKFGIGLTPRPAGQTEEGEGVLVAAEASILGTKVSLETVEKAHIHEVLKTTGGNKNRAAIILGIDRTTLYNKLKKYAIEV